MYKAIEVDNSNIVGVKDAAIISEESRRANAGFTIKEDALCHLLGVEVSLNSGDIIRIDSDEFEVRCGKYSIVIDGIEIQLSGNYIKNTKTGIVDVLDTGVPYQVVG